MKPQRRGRPRLTHLRHGTQHDTVRQPCSSSTGAEPVPAVPSAGCTPPRKLHSRDTVTRGSACARTYGSNGGGGGNGYDTRQRQASAGGRRGQVGGRPGCAKHQGQKLGPPPIGSSSTATQAAHHPLATHLCKSSTRLSRLSLLLIRWPMPGTLQANRTDPGHHMNFAIPAQFTLPPTNPPPAAHTLSAPHTHTTATHTHTGCPAASCPPQTHPPPGPRRRLA